MREDLLKEAIDKLKQEARNDDADSSHYNADKILCELLENLGYKDVVENYNKIPKWWS